MNFKAFIRNKWTIATAAGVAVVGLGVATYFVGKKFLAKKASKTPVEDATTGE